MLLRAETALSGIETAEIGGIEISLGPMGGIAGEVVAAVPAEATGTATAGATDLSALVTPVGVDAAESAAIAPTDVAEEIPADADEPVNTAGAADLPPTEHGEAAAALEPAVHRDPLPVPSIKPAAPSLPRASASTPAMASPATRRTEVAAVYSAAVSAETASEAVTNDPVSSSTPPGGQSTATGSEPGITPHYLDLVRDWLEKHKEYPRRARQRNQEGTAVLWFEVDRQGHVLAYRLIESSGHPILDRAVEAMIERASPVPAMPPDMRQAKLELAVPISFSIR